MSYHIQYGKTTKKERIALMRNSSKPAVIKGTVIGCVLLAVVLLGRTGCLDFLIPGDKAVTKQAFHTMLEDVQEGEDIKTAITAFCVEILEGADEE